MRTARTEVLSLTGLRGVAALGIAIYHFAEPYGVRPELNRFAVPNGYLAVDIFFMMSGFVLAYNYADLFRTSVKASIYGDFMLKRIARIYPAYIAFVALYFAKILLNISGDGALSKFSGVDLVGNILMMTGWGFDLHPIVGPSWSVSAEMLCYVAFPILILYAMRSTAMVALSAVLAMAGVLSVAAYGNGIKGSLDVVQGFWPVVRAMCGFTIGIALYWLDVRYYAAIRHSANVLTVIALGALALCWALKIDDIVKYVFFAMLVLALGQDRKIGRVLFANPVVYYLGLISFSLYLAHSIFISPMARVAKLATPMLGDTMAYWFSFGVYLVLALGLAAISYPILEVRAKKAFLKILRRAKQARVEDSTDLPSSATGTSTSGIVIPGTPIGGGPLPGA